MRFDEMDPRIVSRLKDRRLCTDPRHNGTFLPRSQKTSQEDGQKTQEVEWGKGLWTGKGDEMIDVGSLQSHHLRSTSRKVFPFMKRNTFILWAGILAVGFALAGLAYLGTFTRFMADDFCVAGQALNLGMLDMLSRWYTTVNGRFSAIIISTLLVSGGPGLAGWMPALTVIVWWAGIAWATLPILRRKGLQKPRLLALLLGGISLLALLASTPNLYQSFFWHSGMVTYSLPLVGLTFSAGIILRVWLEDTQSIAVGSSTFHSDLPPGRGIRNDQCHPGGSVPVAPGFIIAASNKRKPANDFYHC